MTHVFRVGSTGLSHSKSCNSTEDSIRSNTDNTTATSPNLNTTVKKSPLTEAVVVNKKGMTSSSPSSLSGSKKEPKYKLGSYTPPVPRNNLSTFVGPNSSAPSLLGTPAEVVRDASPERRKKRIDDGEGGKNKYHSDREGDDGGSRERRNKRGKNEVVAEENETHENDSHYRKGNKSDRQNFDRYGTSTNNEEDKSTLGVKTRTKTRSRSRNREMSEATEPIQTLEVATNGDTSITISGQASTLTLSGKKNSSQPTTPTSTTPFSTTPSSGQSPATTPSTTPASTPRTNSPKLALKTQGLTGSSTTANQPKTSPKGIPQSMLSSSGGTLKAMINLSSSGSSAQGKFSSGGTSPGRGLAASLNESHKKRKSWRRSFGRPTKKRSEESGETDEDQTAGDTDDDYGLLRTSDGLTPPSASTRAEKVFSGTDRMFSCLLPI